MTPPHAHETDCDLGVTGRLALGGELIGDGLVLIRGDSVVFSGPASAAPPGFRAARTLRRGGAVIAPGFVDIHVHGGGGFDVADGTAEAVHAVCAVHARHGTTALCPTVLSSSPEVTLRALACIRDAARAPARPGTARILGAHLEGPFLAPERAGAQPAEHLRLPDPVLVDEFLAAADGTLRIVTLAPELPGALDLVDRLRERGVVVAMGHSSADYDQAMAAIARGCRLGTHTFNAMTGLHHRRPGLVGAILQSDRVTAEVIADLHHVHPAVLGLIWRIKGPERLALITDCTAALEAPPDRARLGNRRVHVEDGAVRLADGTLAGSALTMDRAVANMVRAVGVPLAAASLAASAHGEWLFDGDDRRRAPLAAGSRADLVVLDGALAPSAVVIAGRMLPLQEGDADGSNNG